MFTKFLMKVVHLEVRQVIAGQGFDQMPVRARRQIPLDPDH